MALLSAETLRTVYARGDIPAAEDTTLGVMLGAIEVATARYLGYPTTNTATGAQPLLDATSYTLRLDGDGTETLYLPVAPVTAVTSVYQDATQAFGTGTDVDSGDYELVNYPGGAKLVLLPTSTTGSWAEGHRTIKVTVTAGYATEAALPDDLVHALYAWALASYRAQPARHLESTSKGGASQTLRPLTMPDDVRELLQPLRLGAAYGW